MEYQYHEIEENYEAMKSQDGGVWRYLPHRSLSREEVAQVKPVFGDVTGTIGDTSLRYVGMRKHGIEKNMRIYRYQNKLSFFEKTVGYIPVSDPNGKKGFVRIRKKSVNKILLILAIVVLIISGSIAAILMNQKTDPNLDEHAIAYQLPDGVKNSDPNSILLPGFDVLTMNYETNTVDAALLNPEGNECYFTFSIMLKEGGSELYHTGLIKPGMAVTSFKIRKKLEKGTYPILIKVDAADLNNPENFYNGGVIEAELAVK